MKDKISESGIIAFLIGKRNNDKLEIIELCISCRALGRKLEESIILPSIINMKLFQDISFIDFDINFGPRNKPAREWLKRHFGWREEFVWFQKILFLKKKFMLDSIMFNFNYG